MSEAMRTDTGAGGANEEAVPGRRAPSRLLTNVPRLVTSYYSVEPDPGSADQAISFGTSGHRGTSGTCTFVAPEPGLAVLRAEPRATAAPARGVRPIVH